MAGRFAAAVAASEAKAEAEAVPVLEAASTGLMDWIPWCNPSWRRPEHVRELVGGDTDLENQLRVTHNAYRMYLKVSRLMTDPTDWLMADLWLLASDW